jgi:uncharacterized protein (TIRG00374 family)
MRKKWLLAALFILLLLFALSRLDAESLLHSIGQIPLWMALLLAGLQIVSQLLVNAQWHIIAKQCESPIYFHEMFHINCRGAVMDSVTPGVKIGGEITRALLIAKAANCSKQQSAAIVALQKLFSLSALFTIQLFAVGYVVSGTPVLSYGILLLFLVFFAAIFFMPHKIQARLKKGFMHTLLSHVGHIRKQKRVLLLLALLSFTIWLLYPAKLLLPALQFMPGANPVHLGAIAFVAYMVAMIPIFPGGLGGFEGAMAGLLLAAGFSASDAAVVTILFRFITFWLVMLMSLAYIIYRKGRGALGRGKE